MRPEWRNKQMAFPFHSCTHGQPETPTHNTLPAAEGVSRCALFQSSNTCGRSYMSRDPKSSSALHATSPASACCLRYPNGNLGLVATARSKCHWLIGTGVLLLRKAAPKPLMSPYWNLKSQPCIAVLVLLSDGEADGYMPYTIRLMC